LDAFKRNYRPGADKIRIVDQQLHMHYDEHTDTRETNFGDKNHRPEIDRGPLRDILLASLKPDTVVWDSHILSLKPEKDGWKLIFQNGNSVTADIVIGADGASSKIRPFVTPIKPVWAGVTMIEGVVYDPGRTAPLINELLKGGKIFAYGNSQTLFVSSKGDGTLGFATGHRTTENWVRDSGIDFKDHRQLLAWFKREFAGLFIPRPQYCMPLNQSWQAQANITLIGDAAHWMPPFAGEGVNMAMLDALELSDFLTGPAFTDTRSAIAAYEKRMFKRFARVGRETLFNTEWMHAPDALQDMLSMFSGKKLIKQAQFILKMWIATTLIPFFRK
jgi:2-polyprenyl-6-methoxyphenol hydroxylase-like FAD-dependent oxidoreductase